MAKMKMDFKAILLNHGEKIGAGVVALLGLTGLATARWSSCDLDPTQLRTNADNTKTQWLSSTWPDDRQATYNDTPPVEELAQRMAGSIEQTGLYATSRRWNEPLKQTQEKLQSVSVLPPISPEASLVIFPLVEREAKEEAEKTEDETPKKNTPKKGKKEDNTEDLEKLFGRNTSPTLAGGGGGELPGGLGSPGDLSGAGGLGTPGGPGGLGGLGTPGGPGGLGGLSSGGSEGGASPGGLLGGGSPGAGGLGGLGGSGYGSPPPGGGMGMMGSDGMGSGMGMDGGMNLGILEKKKVRSHAGVSVRYVFNLYAQARQMAEALNLPGNQAQSRVQLVNFEVQRQRAIPGADPWAGQWENVPVDALSEILDASEGFDMDIVLPAVIAYEVSMPLPRRAAGRWTPENASHKLLEEFELSDDEQKVINLMNENLRKEAEKRNAMIPPAMASSGGFSRYSLGNQALMGGLNNSGWNGENSFQNMFNDAYSRAKGDDGDKEGASDGKKSKEEDEQKKSLEKKARNLMAAGRLMLVRFMDFTCDRGTSYRYRVRLEMANPLFNLPIDSLAEPEMAAQRTLFSEWSEPTPPTFVPSGYRYYPDKVESRARSEEYAGMSMYYEHETAGTPLMATVRVPAGSRIGGKQTVEVVNLGENSLGMTEVDLKSLDYLAAVTEAPRLARGEFPELKAAFEAAGTLRPVGDRLTVIDANGAIISRYVGDTVSNGDEQLSRSDDERLTKFVLKTYDNLRPQSADATNNPFGGGEPGSGLSGMGGLGGLSGSGGMDFGGGMREGSSSGSRRGRRGSMGSGMPGGGGMPGMPGGGMPGGGMPGGGRRGSRGNF